jgi:hypothetical protein
VGDRTTVTLTVLKSQFDAVKAITVNTADSDNEFELNGFEFVDLIFDEVNYGDLNRGTKWLDMLMAQGIAFDSRWESGSEYGPGCEYCRFNDQGESVRLEISDSEVNPDLSTLMELIDNPAELKAFIQKHHAESTPLPWTHQEEYGRRYRVKQLITPT